MGKIGSTGQRDDEGGTTQKINRFYLSAEENYLTWWKTRRGSLAALPGRRRRPGAGSSRGSDSPSCIGHLDCPLGMDS